MSNNPTATTAKYGDGIPKQVWLSATNATSNTFRNLGDIGYHRDDQCAAHDAEASRLREALRSNSLVLHLRCHGSQASFDTCRHNSCVAARTALKPTREGEE